jgi:seryl-tRNA(Sec) selenium transferase
MKVSKETLQSLQNVIDLTEQKNKTEQDAISLEKESNEVSAQISEENSAYQRLLDSAREKLESNISVSKQDAKRRGLEKLSSSVPQLPLSQ